MLKVLSTSCFCMIILMFLNNFELTIQASFLGKANLTHYTAGVVEFEPAHYSQPQWTSAEKLQDNLKGYIDILMSTEAQETDIIVFPEMTLNDNDEASFVPDPKVVFTSLCDMNTNANEVQYHDFLKQLSCQARNVSKYVVFNIVEKDYCLPAHEDPRACAATGLNLFNTNIVLDRQGVIISRYRKVHLYGEPRNTTFVPSFGYFDTDFGVRFGHFVCFDLLFYQPAQEMVDVMGIKDFIFPTMWFSQLPFLTAVQMHSAWSYANDVNFLAAGASYPAVGTTGTGIYAGRKKGTLQAVMNTKAGQRKLFVAQLEKHNTRCSRRDLTLKGTTEKQMRSNENIYLKRDYLENYETIQLDLMDTNSFEGDICQRNAELNTQFCCHFEIEWSQVKNNSTTHYNYRLGAFYGLRKEVAPETNLLRTCAIFACTGADIKDCGQVYDNINSSNVVFKHLAIEATFPNATEMLIMPNSLKENLLPIPIADFKWVETFKGVKRKIRYELVNPVSNLLTFSIYGNYYDSYDAKDEPISCDEASMHCDKDDDDGVATTTISKMMLFLGIIVSKWVL